jgi:hypothetical protein
MDDMKKKKKRFFFFGQEMMMTCHSIRVYIGIISSQGMSYYYLVIERNS